MVTKTVVYWEYISSPPAYLLLFDDWDAWWQVDPRYRRGCEEMWYSVSPKGRLASLNTLKNTHIIKVYVLLLCLALFLFNGCQLKQFSVSFFLFVRLWQRRCLWRHGKWGQFTPSSFHLNWTSLLFFLSLFFTFSDRRVNVIFIQTYLQVCVSLCFDTCMLSRTGKKRHRHWQLARRHKTHFDGGSCWLQNVRWTLYIKALLRSLKSGGSTVWDTEMRWMVHVMCMKTL